MSSPQSAMIFAAGFGTRMGALTQSTPKPMLKVAGRPLLDHAIALVDDAKIQNIVVNTHFHGEIIVNHLASRPDIQVSPETSTALETGGGLKRALPLLSGSTVFTLNPDAIWVGENPLLTLNSAWDDSKMDALLLLVPLENALNHGGVGDFRIGNDGHLERFLGDGEPFAYTGAQIIKTELVADHPIDIFSLNEIWDKMLIQERVFGVVHRGQWVDVGTPDGLQIAERVLGDV